MKNIILDENSLNNYKRITSNLNEESIIYTKNNSLFKILLPNSRNENREKNIEELSTYSHDNCIFPRNKIISFNTGEFIGIEEEYLKTYKTIHKYLKNNKDDFDTRKQIAYKICQIENDLEKIKTVLREDSKK